MSQYGSNFNPNSNVPNPDLINNYQNQNQNQDFHMNNQNQGYGPNQGPIYHENTYSNPNPNPELYDRQQPLPPQSLPQQPPQNYMNYQPQQPLPHQQQNIQNNATHQIINNNNLSMPSPQPSYLPNNQNQNNNPPISAATPTSATPKPGDMNNAQSSTSNKSLPFSSVNAKKNYYDPPVTTPRPRSHKHSHHPHHQVNYPSFTPKGNEMPSTTPTTPKVANSKPADINSPNINRQLDAYGNAPTPPQMTTPNSYSYENQNLEQLSQQQQQQPPNQYLMKYPNNNQMQNDYQQQPPPPQPQQQLQQPPQPEQILPEMQNNMDQESQIQPPPPQQQDNGRNNIEYYSYGQQQQQPNNTMANTMNQYAPNVPNVPNAPNVPNVPNAPNVPNMESGEINQSIDQRIHSQGNQPNQTFSELNDGNMYQNQRINQDQNQNSYYQQNNQIPQQNISGGREDFQLQPLPSQSNAQQMMNQGYDEFRQDENQQQQQQQQSNYPMPQPVSQSQPQPTPYPMPQPNASIPQQPYQPNQPTVPQTPIQQSQQFQQPPQPSVSQTPIQQSQQFQPPQPPVSQTPIQQSQQFQPPQPPVSQAPIQQSQQFQPSQPPVSQAPIQQSQQFQPPQPQVPQTPTQQSQQFQPPQPPVSQTPIQQSQQFQPPQPTVPQTPIQQSQQFQPPQPTVPQTPIQQSQQFQQPPQPSVSQTPIQQSQQFQPPPPPSQTQTQNQNQQSTSIPYSPPIQPPQMPPQSQWQNSNEYPSYSHQQIEENQQASSFDHDKKESQIYDSKQNNEYNDYSQMTNKPLQSQQTNYNTEVYDNSEEQYSKSNQNQNINQNQGESNNQQSQQLKVQTNYYSQQQQQYNNGNNNEYNEYGVNKTNIPSENANENIASEVAISDEPVMVNENQYNMENVDNVDIKNNSVNYDNSYYDNQGAYYSYATKKSDEEQQQIKSNDATNQMSSNMEKLTISEENAYQEYNTNANTYNQSMEQNSTNMAYRQNLNQQYQNQNESNTYTSQISEDKNTESVNDNSISLDYSTIQYPGYSSSPIVTSNQPVLNNKQEKYNVRNMNDYEQTSMNYPNTTQSKTSTNQSPINQYNELSMSKSMNRSTSSSFMQSYSRPKYQRNYQVTDHSVYKVNLSQRYIQETIRSRDPMVNLKNGCPLVRFGFGGKIIVMFPQRKMIDPNSADFAYRSINEKLATPGPIMIKSLKSVLDPNLSEPEKRFEGPLLDPFSKKRNKNKKEVLEQISDRILQITSNYTPDAIDDEVVLWKLIKLFIEYNGELFDGEDKEKSTQELRKLLIPRNRMLNPIVDIKQPTISSSKIDELEEFLLVGDLENAIEFCTENKLWTHALIISSYLGKDAYKTVVIKYANDSFGRNINRPNLQMLYGLFSNGEKEIIHSLIPDNVIESPEKWRSTLATILGYNTKESSETIIEFGDRLKSSGNLCAAQICYILSRNESIFSSLDRENSRYVLLGVDPEANENKVFQNPLAIQLTEFYEYALSLRKKKSVDVGIGIPHFQAYKLAYAWWLSDLGYIRRASEYCRTITKIVQSYTKASSYFHYRFLENLRDLEHRCNRAWLVEDDEEVNIDEWNEKITKFNLVNEVFKTSNIKNFTYELIPPELNTKDEENEEDSNEEDSNEEEDENNEENKRNEDSPSTPSSEINENVTIANQNQIYPGYDNSTGVPAITTTNADSSVNQYYYTGNTYENNQDGQTQQQQSTENTTNYIDPNNNESNKQGNYSYSYNTNYLSYYGGYSDNQYQTQQQQQQQQQPSAQLSNPEQNYSIEGTNQTINAPTSVNTTQESQQQQQQQQQYEPLMNQVVSNNTNNINNYGYSNMAYDNTSTNQNNDNNNYNNNYNDNYNNNNQNQEYDDEDDLGFGNDALKKKKHEKEEQNDEKSDDEAPPSPSPASPKIEENKEKGSKVLSLFGNLFGKKDSKDSQNIIKANLGEEKTIYYDPVKKRWVNPNAPEEEEKKLAPPPKSTIKAPTPASSSSLNVPTLTVNNSATPPPAVSSSTSGKTDIEALLNSSKPLALSSKRSTSNIKRGARNRYVDVMANSITPSQGTSSSFIPPPTINNLIGLNNNNNEKKN